MRCPRCSFDGELIDGACAQCGYRTVNISEHLRNAGVPDTRSPSSPLRTPSGVLRSPLTPRSPSMPLRSPSMPLRSVSEPLRSPSLPLRTLKGSSRPLSLATARSGDTLNLGRYRLVDQLILPDNQQGQGAAWLAVDTASGQTQVVIREVAMPLEESARKKLIVRQVALRLSEGTHHAGFPKILDVFDEFDNYFIVLQHIKGESLASLLRRQGGALSERTVAEYGRQLCEMLVVLERQQPPMAHGAINPETVIVSPDRTRVHLIHLPLFPPKGLANASAAVGYKAPEQARGVADPASDLYAVAATMHHAVTGLDPHERIAFFYPPVRRLNPLVTQQMETILAQELRLSAPQRYAHPSDMQSDLASLLATKLLEPERKPIIVPTNDPFNMDMAEIRKRSRQRNRTQLYIASGICLLILLFAGFAYLLPLIKQQANPVSVSVSPTPNATATIASQMSALNNEWKREAPQYQAKGIGLSDGRYVFDTFAGRSAAELNYKKQAAQAVQQGNIAAAINYYGEAVTNDKTDAEARIYYEDLQIQEQNDKYITIVLGVPLDGSALHLSLARPDLQAAFAFQDQMNTQNPSPLPDGAKLRILIGNSGVNNSDAATIAQFVANRVTSGNADNIVAVVGWPTSGESSNAISILAGAHIPIVTQTASSTSLNGMSSYFFRVNPNDTTQGKAQGQFAYQTLGARTVLVLRDPNDPYSQSLADAFTTSFKSLGGKTLGSQADYFTEGQTTVDQFKQQIVNDALINHVDLIFLPGFDVDGVRLAHALGLEEEQYGWSAYLAKLKILGGDGLDTGLILGNGDSADATLARNFPADMQRLIFTSFADQSEWNRAEPPTFLTTWENLYGVVSASNPNPPVPVNTAIMVGDAFGVITYAIEHMSAGQNLRETLAVIGTGHLAAYQGLSGSIAFDSDGNPINKAVVLLQVVASGNGQNILKFLGTSGKTN